MSLSKKRSKTKEKSPRIRRNKNDQMVMSYGFVLILRTRLIFRIRYGVCHIFFAAFGRSFGVCALFAFIVRDSIVVHLKHFRFYPFTND